MATASKTADVSNFHSLEESVSVKKSFPSWLRRSIIFLITFLWFGAFAPLGLDFHHDGVMFIPALRVASGEVVFRDVFCQYGLLSPLLQGFAVWIGGGELLAMKIFSVLFYSGIAVLLDVIWKPLLTSRGRNFLLLMFWGLMPDMMVTFHAWSSIFALFFSLLSLWGVLGFFSGRQWWKLALAGTCAGLTFLSRHPVGVVTAVAIFAALFFEAMLRHQTKERAALLVKNSFIALGGIFLPVAAAFLFLLCNGAWDDFVLQCWSYVLDFVHTRSNNSKWGYLAESLFPFITDLGIYDSLFALLPLSALAWLFIGVRRAAGQEDTDRNLTICVLSIFALGAWHQYYPVPCVRHIFWGGVPFFGLWVMSLHGLWRQSGRYRIACKAVVVIMAVAMLSSGVPRLFAGVNRLSGIPKRKTLDIPGIRKMQLTSNETKMISMLRSIYDNLPEHIRKRGVLNCTPDAMWNVILPGSGFNSPQFLWMKKAIYANYEADIYQHIRQKQPVVLCSQPMYLPGYVVVSAWQYFGDDYLLAVPQK